MNRVLLISLVITFPLAPLAAEDNKKPLTGVEIQKAEEGLGVARVFSRVWAKLRTYIPRPSLPASAASRTQIAGVRGAETTTSRLQPYWKGDKTTDPAYLQELETFVAAIELAEAGEFEKAATAFNTFSISYPDSNLNPNVQFALGMVYGHLGNNEQAIAALRLFAQSHPAHPLADDARQVIKELQERN